MTLDEAGTGSPDPPAAFASLSELRAAQARLGELRRRAAEGAAFWQSVEDFVGRGAASGVLLDDNDERWSVQSLLDYWAAALERAGRPRRESSLAAFDPQLAPELPDATCPYLGLAAFQEEHSRVFFGRGELVDRLVHQLADHHLIALVGPSGCGKSSLALAGLLPRLRQGALPGSETWQLLPPIVPGSHPRATLAGLLAKARAAEAANGDAPPAASPRVIVVDQLEELFTLCTSDTERTGFVDDLLALIASGSPHRLVLTVRSDFESFVARHPALYERYTAGRVAITPPNAVELRQAIERPAELAGLKFEAGVVDRLLQELLGEPAGLPLLQFTLRRLWEERERNRVTVECYKRVGGGRQALARTADAIYDAMIPQDQATARRILLLVGLAVDDKHELTRTRVPRTRLFEHGDDPSRTERVLDRLIEARLLRQTTTDDALQIEVAHEALVRNWPRLAEWLQEAQTSLAELRRLEARAAEWIRLGRGTSALLDDTELRNAERTRDSIAHKGLRPTDEFASLIAASQRRAQAVVRRHRRIIIGVTSFAVLLLALLAFAGWQYLLTQNAELQAADARRRAKEAYEREDLIAKTSHSLALATLEQGRTLVRAGHPLQALPYLAAARAGGVDSTVLRILFGQAAQTIPLLTLGHAQAVKNVMFSPDGTRVVTITGNTVHIWDTTGKPVRPPVTCAGNAVAGFIPRGMQLFIASEDGMAGILDAVTGKSIVPAFNLNSMATIARFSPDGDRLVIASWDGKAQIWNARTAAPVSPSFRIAEPVTAIAFSAQGQRLVTVSDGWIQVWNASTGKLESAAQRSGRASSALSFTADGGRVALADSDAVQIVDTATGKTTAQLLIRRRLVKAIAWSPDGTRILTGSFDGTAQMWDAKTGEPTVPPIRHQDSVNSVAFSPDGTRIVTASDDDTARVWDAATGSPVSAPIEHLGHVTDAAFSPDGQRLATSSSDKTARIWDIVTATLPPSRHGYYTTPSSGGAQAIIQGIPPHLPFQMGDGEVFSPDRTHALGKDSDAAIRIWEVVTGKPLTAALAKHVGFYHAVFSPDGARVLFTTFHVSPTIYDVSTGKPLVTLSSSGLSRVAFSPDGTRVAAGDGFDGIRIWDAGTGRPTSERIEHQNVVLAIAFSRDGKRLITGSADKTARIWDATVGKPLTPPLAHHADVSGVAFSPDGTRVLTVSDGAAHVWDAATGKPVTPRFEDPDGVFAAAFSEDGRQLLTATRNDTVRVWNLYIDNGSLTDWQRIASCSPYKLVDGVLVPNPEPLSPCRR